MPTMVVEIHSLLHLAVSCPTNIDRVLASSRRNICPDLDTGFDLTSFRICPTSKSNRALLSY